MSGWAAALLSVIAVLNPLGISRGAAWFDRSDRAARTRELWAAGLAGVALAVIGLFAAPLLDLLSLSTPTFRLGTSVVVGVTGVVWLVSPVKPVSAVAGRREADVTLSIWMLAPGPVFAALAANSDAGTWAGLIAVGIAVVAALMALGVTRVADPLSKALVRFTGAIALVTAVAIGIDSARSV